ncbi:MAG: energy transducer TonB [Alphaproteobacteria bacterium]|nr:energy transducer TonB [Alphaproteobacteria bacterium]
MTASFSSILSSRMLSSALLAVVTTIVLFLTMKVLVTGRDYEIEQEAASIGIDFVRVERDEDVNTKDRAMKRPSQQKPDEPPPPPKLEPTQRPNADKASMNLDLGQFGLTGMNLNAPVDGDALAIVRVLPRYPSRALNRGIEGWVLLEFAINELGQAVELVVVEADPKGVFDRSAMTAIKKWKYRPMMEDGKPAIRPGVRQLISFNIAE